MCDRPLAGGHARGLRAGTSAQNWSWKRSVVMYRSVVPSLRDGAERVAERAAGEHARQRERAPAGLGREAAGEPDDLAGVGGDF